MSWFFGKKKHKESPPDTTEEEQAAEAVDDFIMIEKRRTSLPPNVGSENAPLPSGLYPFIGGTPTCPAMSTGNLPKLSQQMDAPHYLSGVPFKLSKQLESMNNDFEIDSLRINEIMSYIERLENQNYDYDFSLEESVITEMNSRNDE